MKKIYLTIISVILLTSCVSIPVPENESDSLTVLVTEFKRTTDLETFGSYLFTIRGKDNDYEKFIRVTQNKTYYLPKLEPGIYTVSSKFIYDDGESGGNNDLFYFTVEKGKSRILRYKLLVKIAEKNKYNLEMSGRAIELSDRDAFLENLIEKNPELSNWNWESSSNS